MSAEFPLEVARNLASYQTTSAIAECSVYRLWPEEQYLFPKYYKAGESILDLACGMGRTTLLLHEMGLSVRGVDRSGVMIELAKKRFPYLALQVGSYDRIEEPDSSFSHVLISANGIDLAYPMVQRVTALRECARVLKPGGTFIFCSHNLRSMHWFSPYYVRRLRWKLRNSANSFRAWAYVEENGLHGIFTTPKFVVRQTEEVGLKLIEMKAFSRVGIERLDRYFSPYIHFVSTKPLK